MEGVGLRISR